MNQQKRMAKKVSILVTTAVLTGGTFCQPAFAAQTMTSGKVTHISMHQKKSIKSAKTQGELPDKDGKPSGVHWKFNKENGELKFYGEGVPELNLTEDNFYERPWEEFSHDITEVKIEDSVHPVSMKGWFFACMALKKVLKLPDTLVDGSFAFAECWALETVPETLPRHLKNASRMFKADIRLREAPRLPDSLTNADGMFGGCQELLMTSNFPPHLIDGSSMYADCSNLLKIKKLPKSLKIADSMFESCVNYRDEVPELPDGLSSAKDMFYNCTGLGERLELRLPESLRNARGMFLGCSGITKLGKNMKIPEHTDAYEMFYLLKKQHSVKTWVPYNNESLMKYFHNWNAVGREIIISYCTVDFQNEKGKTVKNVDTVYGDDLPVDQIPEAPKGYHWDSSKLKKVKNDLILKPVRNEDENQTFDFYGNSTWAGKDEHFAKLEYTGKDQAVLYGLSDYGCHIHSYFKGTYASIKVTDAKGQELFSKKYKGTDWSHKDKTEITMPEGATVAIYHAEPSRLQTSSDDSLKKNAVKNTYFYVVKDHKLVSQKLQKQQFNFLGLGDYEFAKMDIVGGSAIIDTKYMAQGPHCYFKDQAYASITIKDENGKVVKKKEYIGQQNEPAGIEEVSLKDGYTVTIYHAEPSRLQTNNDQQLKQHQKENTFSYIYKNQKLIEQ